MPETPFTVSPVISTNEYGEEFINDFNVSTNHQDAVGRDGMSHGWRNDYIEDSEGRYHHMFEGVELESEQQGSSFDEEAYIEALIESNPDITAAQQWAVDNLPDEWVEEYDKQIESGSLDEMNQAVEWLLTQYANRPHDDSSHSMEEQQQEEKEEQEEESDDLTPEEEQFLGEVVDDLQQQEPLGQDTAAEWQQAVTEAEESGDGAYAMVAAATAAFHDGDVTAEEAIAFCVENVPLKELARVYKMLS